MTVNCSFSGSKNSQGIGVRACEDHQVFGKSDVSNWWTQMVARLSGSTTSHTPRRWTPVVECNAADTELVHRDLGPTSPDAGDNEKGDHARNEDDASFNAIGGVPAPAERVRESRCDVAVK